MGIIYAIRQTGTSDVRYVGKTVNTPERRLMEHKRDARGKGRAYLHKWLRSIDLDVEIFVLEEVSPDDLDDRERAWIAKFRADGARLTNLTEGGEGGATWLGRKHTPESRAKIGAAHRGRRHTPEARARMGGRPSDEAIAKISAALKGRPLTAEHRAAISAAKMGRPLSAEHRAAMSRANKGKPSPLRGIPKSEETRAKMRAAHTGPDGGCLRGHNHWESNGTVNGQPQRTCRICRLEREARRKASRGGGPFPWVTG